MTALNQRKNLFAGFIKKFDFGKFIKHFLNLKLHIKVLIIKFI